MENIENELEIYEEGVDTDATKTEIALRVANSPRVMEITKTIDINSTTSIVKFADATAVEITSLSDKVLQSIENTKVEDSGELLVQLNKIMDKFDIKDFEDDKPKGLIAKIFNKAKNSIDELFAKYNTMGTEVEKVNVMLKEYESEILKTNEDLQKMYDANIRYYEELELYIHAGKYFVHDMNTNVLPLMETKVNAIEDNRTGVMELNNTRQMVEMLEQRIYDLELAQNISLQSLPSIKMIQKGNSDLVRKINSAFIVTLPIFKKCLIDAIVLKRQSIQAKAVSALDEKTKELLERNAENTALQSKMTAQLASGNFVDVETLEKTWNTIVNGIEETKRIEDEAKVKREQGRLKLEELKTDFAKKASQSK